MTTAEETGDDLEVLQWFPNRAVRIRDEYDRRLRAASANVDLIGFGLRAFRGDYADYMEQLSSKATVRFLLLDPHFPAGPTPFASLRDQEERNASGSIQQDVNEFLIQIGPLTRRTDLSISIRLYRALPVVNIFRIDDDLFWGPYLIGEQSRNSPTCLVQRGSSLYDRFVSHFETVWSEPWSVGFDELDPSAD